MREADHRYDDPGYAWTFDPEDDREPHRDGHLPKQPVPTPEGPPLDHRHVP